MSELKIMDLFSFSFLDLRLGVSMVLYVIVTCHMSHVTEGHKRFQNNNVILHINSI